MSRTDIRPAGRGDVAAITRIYGAAVANGTATFEIEPPPEAEMARRLEALLAKDFPYLVAERAGVVGGYAYAAPYHVQPATTRDTTSDEQSKQSSSCPRRRR